VVNLKLPFVVEDTDRHGNVRRYVRVRRGAGARKVRLHGEPGSDQFMAEYHAALAQQPAPKSARPQPGTVGAAIVGFYNSLAFRDLSPYTQRLYKGVYERVAAVARDLPIAGLTRKKIEEGMAARQKTPVAANVFLKRMRQLMAYALTEGMITADPTAGIKPLRIESEGFKTWPDEYVAAYRARHPLGSMARLALELLIGTGQRRSDVVRLGRQHVRAGDILSFRQFKGRRRAGGQEVHIPILPELRAALDAMPPSSALTFLLDSQGKPFVDPDKDDPADAFTDWFGDRCREAGVPKGFTGHGLRKYAATRLANNGATAHELMSWFGWKSIKEAERYTKAADRKRLALAAAARLTPSGR
jgi:integrase